MHTCCSLKPYVLEPGRHSAQLLLVVVQAARALSRLTCQIGWHST